VYDKIVACGMAGGLRGVEVITIALCMIICDLFTESGLTGPSVIFIALCMIIL